MIEGKHLTLDSTEKYSLFASNKEILWVLDSDGFLYTYGSKNIKLYLGKSQQTFPDGYWTYKKVTEDKSQALKLDKQSIIKNDYDPLFIPILYNGKVIFPGGGKANIFKKGTCIGYYLYFEKV